MKVVKLVNLTKKFGDLVAVNQISMEIEAGEIYGLLGPNGAGKSSAINMICSLLRSDKGEIFLFEKDLKRETDFCKRKLGIVPQDLAIYEDLSAVENVKFFASLYGLKGNLLKECVEEALGFVGLSDQAKIQPKGFSGGMKRRLNIACALAHRPQLIIMDEPTVGIDPQSRNHILQAVQRLNQMGCTIIYTSHYMEEVEEICTRIGIMDHGKLIAEGTKEELTGIITTTNSIAITVDSLANLEEAKLKAIKGVERVEIEEKIVQIHSRREVNNLDQIILYFTNRGMAIKSLESKTPDLETVFLTLTGRKLRD